MQSPTPDGDHTVKCPRCGDWWDCEPDGCEDPDCGLQPWDE